MDFERWMKELLVMECYCLKRLSVEGLWGGFLYWGPWKICKERLQIWASLSIGAPFFMRQTWNQEGWAWYTRDQLEEEQDMLI
jgi:hypothetical protein